MRTYHALINLLINNNKEIRREKNKEFYSAAHYAREYCTIHLNIGRQSGKTTYIIENATKNDLIVVCNRAMHDYILDQSWHKQGRAPTLNIFVASAHIDNLLGREFQTIYVDEPTHCFEKIKRMKLYEATASKVVENQTFILLGE